MVELTGTPYTQFITAALLPALLYSAVAWFGIDAHARRLDLGALLPEQQPGPKEVVVRSAFFIRPFTVLLRAMFWAGYAPQSSAALAIIAGAVLLLTRADVRLDLRCAGGRAEAALIGAARQVSLIEAIILCASIIIGMLAMTGLGVKTTSLICRPRTAASGDRCC